jgi:hypothetical protein
LKLFDRRQAQTGQDNLRHPHPEPTIPDREQLDDAAAAQSGLEIVGSPKAAIPLLVIRSVPRNDRGLAFESKP